MLRRKWVPQEGRLEGQAPTLGLLSDRCRSQLKCDFERLLCYSCSVLRVIKIRLKTFRNERLIWRRTTELWPPFWLDTERPENVGAVHFAQLIVLVVYQKILRWIRRIDSSGPTRRKQFQLFFFLEDFNRLLFS